MFGKRVSKEAPAATVTVQDGAIAEAWNRSLTEWAALSDSERRDLRNRVAYAPNLSAV